MLYRQNVSWVNWSVSEALRHLRNEIDVNARRLNSHAATDEVVAESWRRSAREVSNPKERQAKPGV
jgi:hypothetical protein